MPATCLTGKIPPESCPYSASCRLEINRECTRINANNNQKTPRRDRGVQEEIVCLILYELCVSVVKFDSRQFAFIRGLFSRCFRGPQVLGARPEAWCQYFPA